MCTCASCEYTDSFAGKGFAAWPRGDPAGPRSSAAAYSAHATHCGAKMPKPWRYVSKPPQFSCYGLHAPIAPAPKWLHDWINRKAPDRAEARPASPETPAKAPQHFPELDRQPEASNIYTMPKDKRPVGRPPIVKGGMRRVLVTLDDATIEKAKRIGNKQLSPGLREAVKRCKVA